MLNNELLMAAGEAPDYIIGHSVRFNSTDSAYMNRTPGVAGNQKTWTLSFWMKRSVCGSIQCPFGVDSGGGVSVGIYTGSDDTLTAYVYYNGTWTGHLTTTQVFRDPSAWVHIVLAVDTTKATSSDRIKLYVDGTQVTAFLIANYPAQNTDSVICSNVAHNIGRTQAATYYLNSYIADFYLIDGQALQPTSFGKISTTTSNWVPIAYSGTYGTTGFHLGFASGGSAAALGTDTSGNSNTWTVNNISVAAGTGNDWLNDAPSNNYCTLNPLVATLSSSTLANGALDFVGPVGTTATIPATFAIPVSGKWYWEFTESVTYTAVGIVKDGFTLSNIVGYGDAFGWGYYGYNGQKYNNGGTAYGNTYTVGDVIGIAFDADTGKLYFSKNGSWQNSGDPVAGTGYAFTGLTSGLYYPAFSDGNTSAAAGGAVNFGQRDFSYTPPTGFKALNQTNLPEPITTQPYLYNNTALWAGTSAPQSIVNLHLKPDLTWIKTRSITGNNVLYDSVRGATKKLGSDTTAAESTVADSLLAFLDDGFSLGASADGDVNYNGRTYVAWNWKESVTAGFDIVSYAGTGIVGTIAHNLGVVPELMLVKRRDSATYGWAVYHKDSNASPASGYLELDNTAAFTADGTMWNSTLPSSSVFTIGTSAATNANGGSLIAYLFASKEGYSKVGKYTGNGSADGPFVYCGFKPRWLLVKRSSASGNNWVLVDAARAPYDVRSAFLAPNSTQAEDTATTMFDFTANGFKARASHAAINNSGDTYIFAAFAESPFKYPRTQYSSSQTGLNLKGLRFDSADSSYLSKTLVAGNRQKFTHSAWVKRSAFTGTCQLVISCIDSGASAYWMLEFSAADQLQLYENSTVSGNPFLVTSSLYRDPSQWYHVVVAVDTTQATAADRVKLYVNGVQVTAFGTATYPAQNTNTNFNTAAAHAIGSLTPFSTLYYLNGYLSDVYLIDGQQLTPTAFAESNATTGQWVPKIYTGTYGTNGCHLTFADSSSTAALGYDTSGNGNNWTVNNMSVTNDRTQDCLSDSPTENYCTLSPIENQGGVTIANGALDVTAGNQVAFGAWRLPPGKSYWELTQVAATSSCYLGVGSDAQVGGSVTWIADEAFTYNQNGNVYNGNSVVGAGATYTTGDVIGFAVDTAVPSIAFYKNGTLQYTATLSSGRTWRPMFYQGGSPNYSLNFGQRTFAFTPPTGFKALNSTNLPTPAVLLPNRYFDVSLYTGSGS
jgi:hypothetical protein